MLCRFTIHLRKKKFDKSEVSKSVFREDHEKCLRISIKLQGICLLKFNGFDINGFEIQDSK